MRIKSEECMGLVIDIQEKLIPHMNDNEALLKRLSILIKGFQVLEVPVLITEQYTRGLGNTVEPIRSLFNGFSAIEKISFSCYDDPLFAEQADRLGRKFVIIAGIEAHVCVLQTAEDILDQGNIPVIIEDCISSRRINDKQIALARMQREGAIVSTTESILFELCRYAGNERFKAISALIK